MSSWTVAGLLHSLGYSLQANRKTMEGTHHPNRDAQFRYVNERVRVHLRRRDPVISVDTKKKELVGTYKNGGREWQPKGEPEEVNIYDFISPSAEAPDHNPPARYAGAPASLAGGAVDPPFDLVSTTGPSVRPSGLDLYRPRRHA